MRVSQRDQRADLRGSPWARYGLAVASVAVTGLIRWALDPWLGYDSCYILFYFPIALTAYLAGWRPGMLALVLGTVVPTFFFVRPRFSFFIENPGDVWLFYLFVSSAGMMAVLGAWAHHGRYRALTLAASIRRLLERMTDGYIVLDRQWRILDANDAAQRVADRFCSSLVGRFIWDVFPHAQEFRAVLEQALSTGQSQHTEAYYPPLEMWLDVTAYPAEEGLALFVSDITARKRAEVQLASVALFPAENPDPVLRIAAGGALLYCNPTAQKLLQRIDRSTLDRLPPELERPAITSLQTGTPGEFEFVCCDQRVFSFVCVPFPDKGYANLYARDITERKAALSALADAKAGAERAQAQAEHASKAKDHFLAVLSHELRTPLTPVVTALSLLEENGNLDPLTRESLDMIRRNVELEARLIDDLLDTTRIARGKIELARKPADLGDVLRRTIEVCMPDIETRQLDFEAEIPADACRVDADAVRLQQVFWNVLRNAIKFTPPGGRIALCVRADQSPVPDPSRPAAYTVEITDNGEGIEPQALGRIFNAFEQGERSITRQFGGLGLGLTISKALVEMHGGTIEARSPGKGGGATFIIRLPALADVPAPVDAPAAAPTQAASAIGEPATRPLRILLVEDHGDTARTMRRLLMRKGFEVQCAGDVATALKAAQEQPFDLLLSDLGLPDASGHDLLRELRARGIVCPGIALSGYGQEEDIRRSRDVGFAAHLTKPASPDRIADAIDQVIKANPR